MLEIDLSKKYGEKEVETVEMNSRRLAQYNFFTKYDYLNPN